MSKLFQAREQSVTACGQVLIANKPPADCDRFDFCGNGESEGNFRYGNYVKEVSL